MILQILNDRQAQLNDRYGNEQKAKGLVKPCLVIGIIILILPFLLDLDVEAKIGLPIAEVCIILIPAVLFGITREVDIDKSKHLIQGTIIIFGLLKRRWDRRNFNFLRCDPQLGRPLQS